MGTKAMQTPEKQVLPIAPTTADPQAMLKWAQDLTRTLAQNLATIARKANDNTSLSPIGDLDMLNHNILGVNNLTVTGTFTYKGADIDTRYVNVTGDTMTGALTTATAASGLQALIIPHGAAPSAPSNGSMWSTTGGFFGQVNGATKTLAVLETAQTFTPVQTFSAGWKLDATFVADISASNPRITFDTNDAYIYDRTANAHNWYVGGTIKGLVDTNGFNGVLGATTAAAINGTTGTFSGALSGITTLGLSGAISSSGNPATAPTLNAAGNATSLAQNAEIVLSNNSGILIINDFTNGAVGVVAVGGGTVSVIYAGPGTQYVNTSTPTTAQIGVYFSSTYRIRNGFAATRSVGVMWLSTRNSV